MAYKYIKYINIS